MGDWWGDIIILEEIFGKFLSLICDTEKEYILFMIGMVWFLVQHHDLVLKGEASAFAAQKLHQYTATITAISIIISIIISFIISSIISSIIIIGIISSIISTIAVTMLVRIRRTIAPITLECITSVLAILSPVKKEKKIPFHPCQFRSNYGQKILDTRIWCLNTTINNYAINPWFLIFTINFIVILELVLALLLFLFLLLYSVFPIRTRRGNVQIYPYSLPRLFNTH